MARDLSPLVHSVSAGDRPKALRDLADVLAEQIMDPYGKQPLAPLAKELANVLREIDQLPVAKGSKVDDLGDRRAARRAKAAGS
jgi:hypothetical protein